MTLKRTMVSRIISVILVLIMLLSNTGYGFADTLTASASSVEPPVNNVVEKTNRDKTEILVKMRGGSLGGQLNSEVNFPSIPDLPNDSVTVMPGGAVQSVRSDLSLSATSSESPEGLDQIVDAVKRELSLQKTEIKYIDGRVKKEKDKAKQSEFRLFATEATPARVSKYAVIEIDESDDINAAVSELSKYKEIEGL